MLLTFVASTALIDDTMFSTGSTDMNLHFLTMQSTRFRQYGKYKPGQMVELYVASMLIMENLKVYGDWIYEQYHVVEERPIVWYNPATQKKEYICAVCGRPESEHVYAKRAKTEGGEAVWVLQDPKHRCKHAFRRMTRPLQNRPKVFTGTYRRKMTIEDYLRTVTGRHRHFSMWLKRTECKHEKIVDNIRKSHEENPTHKTMAARSYRDGQMNCKTGVFYPSRCTCYRFMNDDADGHQIESLDNINVGGRDHFRVNPEVVPNVVPDNGCPRACPRCRATPRPFQKAPVMFHDAYMDMPLNHFEMAGEWHPDFLAAGMAWNTLVLAEFIARLSFDDVQGILESKGVRLEEAGDWRAGAVNAMLEHDELLQNALDTNNGEFFDRVSDAAREDRVHRGYFCAECGRHFLHPCHRPRCAPTPYHANFNVCANGCECPLDDPIHHPACRARITGNLYQNMEHNPDEVCFRCKQGYAACSCPCTGEEGGFFPYLMKKEAKRNLRTPHETIFLNQVQKIPQKVYNFILAFQGRALGEYAGTGMDELDGLVLFYGPKRTGKSKFIEDFAEHFPEDERGEISDNAEEQWWSAHLVHPMNTNETVKLFTCCELSPECKIPMTEWQILCDQKLITIHAKFQTARRVQIKCTVFVASNWMPFRGAMSRRSVSVYLKHTIPEQFIDTSLPIRMRSARAVHQYRAVLEYLDLIEGGRKPQLNAVWPEYFREQQHVMEVQTQPIIAFLKGLSNNTPGCWRVVPTDTPELRKVRMKNYVPLSRLKRHFQKWCNESGVHHAKWDSMQWNEAKDMFCLKEKNRSLIWKKHSGDVETLRRDYVFGILDPSQAWSGGGQPGAGEVAADNLEDDSEDEFEEKDMAEAITVNGMPIGQAYLSNDVEGVFQGINGALRPEMLTFLFHEAITRRQSLGEEGYRKDMVQAVLEVVRGARMEDEIMEALDSARDDNPRAKRMRPGPSMTQ